MSTATSQLAPTAGTKTGRVWELADAITKNGGRLAPRKQVIDAFVAEGGNANTASTQYWLWKCSREGGAAQPVQAIPGNSAKFTLQIAGDGRLLIPAEVREAMLIGEAGTLSARVVDGELRIVSPKVAVLRMQQLVKQFDSGKGSAVDELIAERKAET